MSDDLTGNEPESQPEQPPESQPEEQPESHADSGHGESGSNHGRRLTIMIVASIILAIASSLIVPPVMFTDADRAAAEKIESEIWDLEQEMVAVQSKIEDLKGTLKNDEQASGDDADQVRAEIDELDATVKKYQKQIADLRKDQPSEESTVALFEAIGIGGEVFLRALTMMVVPLVMASVMSGILGMGDVRKLGRPGLVAILYYFSTTILAVVVGLAVVNMINPGSGFESDQEKFRQLDTNKDKQLDLAEFQENVDEFEKTKSKRAFILRDSDENGELSLNEFKGNNDDVEEVDRKKVVGTLSRESGLDKNKIEKIFPQLAKEKEEEGEEGPSMGTIFSNLLLMLFTDNLFAAAADTQLLPLIVFSIIFAGMLTTLGSKVDDMTELISEANTALMSFVMLLMNLAPVGIFCLVASRFGEAQAKGEFIETLSQTGSFVLTVLLGLGAHLFGTLPLLYWIFKRKNPYHFMKNMSRALLTAFSTASSSATLPVTMECATQQAGVSKRSVDFVLPLGATINMDGTALYEAAAAIFIAQVYMLSPEGIEAGFQLKFSTQVIIAVTATLAAIGAAGIPEAGLVTMMIVLNAVGLPLEYVSLILSVDWLLDRFRTATNTFGDAVGAAIVDETFDDS
ncbi:MAG: cation:dicarboxylase symporter family transporter [Planctomycetales bacterium]|nr:cation:dicarboxylase symporter family transporter [Planctomycetales bacterium]